MSAWRVVISAPSRSWTAELPMGRSVVLGRAAGLALQVDEPSLADRQLSLLARDEGVLVEPLRSASEVSINDVPTGTQSLLRPGDELRAGEVRLLLLPQAAVAPQRPRVTGEGELIARLEEELRRADTRRPVALSLIASPGINLSARQALTRRVLDEVQRSSAVACFAQLTTDVLAVLVPELNAAGIEQLFARLKVVAGPRATVATAQAPTAGLDAHALLGACWDRLLTPTLDHPEPLFVNPALVHLVALVERLVERGASVCVVGPPGSGRRTLLEHVLRSLGRTSAAVSALSVGARGSEALVLRDVELLDRPALTRVAETLGAPLLATASRAPVGQVFQHVIELPALAARRDEIVPLAEAIVSRVRVAVGRPRLALSSEAVGLLRAWPWPGNVRELVNVLVHAARATARDEIGRDALPERLWSEAPANDFRASMESAERELLLETLGRTRWNVTQAAQRLELPRRTLVHRMMKLGLKRPVR